MTPVLFNEGYQNVMSKAKHKEFIADLLDTIIGQTKRERAKGKEVDGICMYLVKDVIRLLWPVQGARDNNDMYDAMYSRFDLSPTFIAWAERKEHMFARKKRIESIALFKVHPKRVYISWLCSLTSHDPSQKCKHVTTRLLAYIHNSAKLAGIPRIELNSVDDARAFYDKVGMRTQSFYDFMTHGKVNFYHNNSFPIQESRIQRSRSRTNTQVRPTNLPTKYAIARLQRLRRGRSAASEPRSAKIR
jgi:hypothetical protein